MPRATCHFRHQSQEVPRSSSCPPKTVPSTSVLCVTVPHGGVFIKPSSWPTQGDLIDTGDITEPGRKLVSSTPTQSVLRRGHTVSHAGESHREPQAPLLPLPTPASPAVSLRCQRPKGRWEEGENTLWVMENKIPFPGTHRHTWKGQPANTKGFLASCLPLLLQDH